jgi:hypothetical protein
MIPRTLAPNKAALGWAFHNIHIDYERVFCSLLVLII